MSRETPRRNDPLTSSSAVTAVYKGTKKAGTGQILLRSYDSRKETSIEPNATIWQAGRATSATALAFKPIQVGQSVFLDEGAGKYNPASQCLDLLAQARKKHSQFGPLLKELNFLDQIVKEWAVFASAGGDIDDDEERDDD